MSLNLPPQMQGILDALPSGANLFDYIQSTLDEEVFPTLSKAFWAQVWAAIALLCLVVVGFLAGFAIRIHRRRTKIIISDGQLTRLDPKVFVPVLWTCVVIFDVVLSILLRANMRAKSHSVVIGRFWLFHYLPLVVSYVLVGSNVLASTPAFRKHFISMHRGALWLNLGTLGISLAMCAGMVAPAIALGDALHTASVAYNQGVLIVQQANSTGDVTQLLALQDTLGQLEQAHKDNVAATREGNAVYAAYIAIVLLACIIPGYSLNRYVNRKISRLEQDKSSNATRNISGSDVYNGGSMPLHDLQKDLPTHTRPSGQVLPRTRLNFVPEQPKDRPFAHLVIVATPLLPARFDNILQDQSQSNATRALRLRKALRTDMRFLAAYTLQLCAFMAMNLFLCVKSVADLSTRQDISLSLAFPAWNIIVPGLIVSGAFVYDALTHQDGEDTNNALPTDEPLRHITTKPSTIQCNQTVDIAYTSEQKEKHLEDMEDEELQSIRGSWNRKS